MTYENVIPLASVHPQVHTGTLIMGDTKLHSLQWLVVNSIFKSPRPLSGAAAQIRKEIPIIEKISASMLGFQ